MKTLIIILFLICIDSTYILTVDDLFRREKATAQQAGKPAKPNK